MQHNQDQHRQQRGKPPFPFNSAPINADLTRLLEISSKVAPYHGSPPRAPTRPPRQNPPGSLPRRRRVSSSPSRHRVPSSNGSHAGDFEQHQYEPPGALYRSSSDQRLDSLHRDPERECVRRSNPPRPASLGRPPCTRSRSSARSDDLRAPGGLRKRSQSLGDRMALAVANPREPPPPSSLLLYHVSRPEPRARWVFNLSKHNNVLDSGPPPDTITSTIDKKRPNLGGLVWINAVLGNLHCCLQKGVKNKAVTPVPVPVLDGWLNGQTGFWWIGALKEGHRALWDSHVVMNWAMVFIPSSPEVAARNNMEVWHDKCLPGSLRVARPGELARKILDIVADDQDKEPEEVVHTHLCILLAEGDDLELKRPKMVMPPAASTASAGAASPSRGLTHSKSLGTMDLSQVSLDKDGTARIRSGSGDRLRSGSGDTGPASGGGGGGAEAPIGAAGSAENVAALEEALEKVAKYRERIVILKEDRRSKKAMLEQLRGELIEKEEALSEENERLRLERNDVRDRAKALWADVEDLRRDSAANAVESQMSREDAEGLKKLVDRLRRERNSARSDAMRWLEQQRSGSSPDGGDGDVNGVFPKTPARSRGLGSRARSAPDGMVSGAGSMDGGAGPGKVLVDAKAATAIAKLKSKVDRLRRERDEAEKQAAVWLRAEQEKLARAQADAAAAVEADMNGGGGTSSLGGPGAAVSAGSGGAPGGGPVVASLKAEGLKLKRELQEAREEAERLRRMSSYGTIDGAAGGGGGGVQGPARAAKTVKNGEPEAAGAQQALGRLLGQALNLLGPQGADGATTAATSEKASRPALPATGVAAATSSAVSTSAAPLAAPQGHPFAATASSAGVAVPVPVPPPGAAETTTEPPPPEAIELGPQASQVSTESQESAKTSNGTSVGGGSGDDDAAVEFVETTTGLVGERIRQFAKTNGAAEAADAGTLATANISETSSPAVDDGMGPTSTKTWSAPTAELVEASAGVSAKAE